MMLPGMRTTTKVPMLKRSRFGGIRSRLVLLLLVVLVPVLVIEALVFYRTLATRKSEELLANLEVARAVAKNFQTFVNDIVHGELVIGLALTSSPAMTDRDRNRLLDSFQADNTLVRSVFWVNPDGRIAFSSLRAYVGFDVGDRSFVRGIISGRDWAISELILGKATGRWAFTISRGIRNEQGKLLGIVAASIEPDRLDSVLGVARSMEAGVSLVDNKGTHVYRYPRADYTPEQRNWLNLYPVIEHSLKGKEVTTSHVSKLTGKKRLVAFAPVPPIGWVAAASRAEDEVMKPIIATLGFQAGMILLVTFLGFIAAWALSRPISNAVIRLRNQAVAMGQGETADFDIASGPDELRDLSLALGKMAEEVRIRERQLETTNKELESFSFSVSHDLRAPLRAIEGYVRMILKRQGEKFDEETKRQFDVVRDNAKTMGKLIDDLLAFSRLGRQELAKVDLDMAALIRDAWQELVTIHPDRVMTLKVEPMPAASGDPTLIRQVCGNLLGNAVKFTQGRSPAVIEAGCVIKGNETVCYIRDNGIGFDMKYHDKLFGVFQRLHGDQEYEGTGIGLAIVQRIINRHGGRIWAEGKADEGATFFFTLPRPKPLFPASRTSSR